MTATRGSVTIGSELIHYREAPKQEIGISYNDPTSKREWMIDGSLDRDVIIQVAASIIPAVDVCYGVSRFFERYDLKELGGGAWLVPVQYRSKPAYWELSISTTGGSAKMLQSFSTPRAYSTGWIAHENASDWKNVGAVPNFKRAIGVNGNNVEGVEIVIPKFDFQINYKFTMSTLSVAYLMALYNLVGKANRDAYTISWNGQSLTFAAGDLRFMGFPAKQSSDNQLDLTFMFSASKGLAGGTKTTEAYTQPADGSTIFIQVETTDEFTTGQYIYVVGESATGERIEGGVFQVVFANEANYCLYARKVDTTGDADAGTLIPAGALISADYEDENPLSIGGSLPIRKKGWEYLWVYYEERTDLATGRTVKVPIGTYIEQVTKYGNFNSLNIV